MIVVLGVMQFQQGAFGAAFLNGVHGVQTPGALFQALALIVDRVGAWFGIPGIHVRTAHRHARKIPVAQVVHHAGINGFLAVGVEVGAVIPPHVEAAVGGGVGWRHTLQEEALIAFGFHHGAFQPPVELTGGVTEGQRLQPGQAVVNAVSIVFVADAVFRAVELVAGG
ncbi:hypothetical protein D3C79_706140 [compost metagenome]